MVSVEYCRDQARQFVERVEAREARAAALAAHSLACPFDLQVLLPIPPDILELGMRHPTAIAWLAQHWGTEHRLVQVTHSEAARPGRRIPADHRFLGYSFFTVDQGGCSRQARQQRLSALVVADLAGGEVQQDRPPGLVADGVQFGVQAAFGASQTAGKAPF